MTLGGVYREGLKIIWAQESRFTGEELPAHKISVAGMFVGGTQRQTAD